MSTGKSTGRLDFRRVDPERIVRLRQILVSQGLKQKELASAIGVSEQHLSNILGGRQAFPVEVAELIGERFGVSPGWLLFGEEPSEARVEEGRSSYSTGLRLPGVDGEGVELPPGVHVWPVADGGLEPVWHRGQRLLVVRAEKGEAGPAVVRVGRTAWRVIGVLF